MPEYCVGPRVYKTKRQAKTEIQNILHKYQPGQTVVKDDHVFLLDLILNHPESTQKVGIGVASFQVENSYNNKCFWLTRTDGSRTDFSYLQCITPVSRRSKVLAGFRTAIKTQIFAFKDRAFLRRTVTCPITQKPLTRATCHVDHVLPFVALVDRFLVAIERDITQIEVHPTKDGSTEFQLVDEEIVEAWQWYHEKYALLRVVSIEANLSILRKNA